MGIFSKFESKMEDGLEGAAGKIFNAPISPVQISKKAEKAMRREKMVGAGKQYAPTLYTVLVNAEDDHHLFGYYPTLAGETETYLAARAAEDGLTMDGQPLVRFIVDSNLKHGKFDVVAELVSAPIVAQLRREEMQRYGLLNKSTNAGQAAGTAPAAAAAPMAAAATADMATPAAAPAPTPAPAAIPAPVPEEVETVQEVQNPQAVLADAEFIPEQEDTDASHDSFSHQAYAERLATSQAIPEDIADPADNLPKKQPLPYVPEDEIDRSIDYGEYTFNSQDFEDYKKHGPSAQLITPAAQRTSGSLDSLADLSGFDVEAYNPYTSDSQDFETLSTQQPAANPATAPAVNTHVFVGGAATPEPSTSAVKARLVNTSTNRDYNLVGGRLIMGRSRSCDIPVDDINVSRSHAELRCESSGAWILTDLGSTNGTKVNGERITSCILNPGDRILLGTTDLIFLEG